MAAISFETHPNQYRHWKLVVDGPIARLWMDVVQDTTDDDEDYQRKLNSYDISVDIELWDATNRLRFEHPEVRVVVISSAKDRIFCAGANIFMLAGSTHPFKVNFCKFTNETRLYIEDASEMSGQTYIAALNGTASGGGYELALACDEIYLVDDRSSAVSFPEVPLLAVLPGTGGLTRLVDKRKVRKDLADVFSTTAEGIKGKRAQKWGLVDDVVAKSRFEAFVEERARQIAAENEPRAETPVHLTPLAPNETASSLTYRYVNVSLDTNKKVAHLTIHGPAEAGPQNPEEIRALGADWWPLRAYRELDDLLLRLRFHHETIGLVVVSTRGDGELLLATEAPLVDSGDDWFIAEVRHHMRRVLKRLEATARSFFAVADHGSCFAGSLFEVLLACDRTYMLDDRKQPVTLHVSELSAGLLPMANGLSRLETRFLGTPDRVNEVLLSETPFDAESAAAMGLVTFTPDELDWDDEVRIAIEERSSLSPDALTGMEASLRFAGPETMETKIFARLSAWQNWIFQRPNSVGERGALSLYGKPERAQFDWRRT